MWPFKRVVPEVDKALPAKQVHGGSSPPDASIVIAGLEAKLRAHKHRIAYLEEALRDRNRALDAMHYIWCSGGCKTGAHRWTPNTITEEVVQEAEHNTKRLRQWWNSKQYREQPTQRTGVGHV